MHTRELFLLDKHVNKIMKIGSFGKWSCKINQLAWYTSTLIGKLHNLNRRISDEIRLWISSMDKISRWILSELRKWYEMRLQSSISTSTSISFISYKLYTSTFSTCKLFITSLILLYHNLISVFILSLLTFKM